MKETPEDLQHLQIILDQSFEQAGSFLRHSFQMPDHSLSAAQLVRYLQGFTYIAFATATSRGEPRVAPIGSLFYRGHFYLPTTMSALRVKHIKRQSAVSLTHFAENSLAIIVHGHARILIPTHPEFAVIEQIQRAIQQGSPREWGDGAYLRVEADVIYTYARYPERYSADPLAMDEP
ncbi:pyridoxamine 5'-phosphate oxidase family protein [Dictyobacter aurantiacus]|uniref:Pyridoxamine 5'-phosphate oxidase N-terminal domain-containing protein n=1 Tax=Dictyobacter aurantiacus TaxID=1936993 RepID=A0A401ZNS8_9CHLR|nr:pyridoxamine 5'-phosphate oxidase family protein [Dictyobacter aurantiacus]GCE08460.1 hypothetical protein KDAU_57890 [Dictyobacter aurantiacus]